MVPLSTHSILHPSIHDFLVLLYLICALLSTVMSTLLSIPQEYPLFASSPASNLMGYETWLNCVKDPVVPCNKVGTAGDPEPDLVCGGENGM